MADCFIMKHSNKGESGGMFKGTILPNSSYNFLLGDESGEPIIFNPEDSDWGITMCFMFTNLVTL